MVLEMIGLRHKKPKSLSICTTFALGKIFRIVTPLGIIISSLFAGEALGYTYLAGGKGLRADANGVITFYRTSEFPEIEDVEDFENGAYAGLSNEQIYLAFIARTIALWNAVPGKSYTIKLADQRIEAYDGTDNRNVITLFSPAENKLGGDAKPILDDAKTHIKDCDMRVGRKTTASDLGIILAHEMGHCLGLGHEHKELNAVMSYNRNSFKLTLDDAAGAASIYPALNAGANSDLKPCGSVSFLDHSRAQQSRFRIGASLLLLLPMLLSFLVSGTLKQAWSKRRSKRN